jgi:predicted O-methyltransferase YrrM
MWKEIKKRLKINIRRTEAKKGYEFYKIIHARNVADLEQLDIIGEFPKKDAEALEKVVKKVLKERIMIAEVGSWKGMSTSVLAKAVGDYNGKVFAIDHWMGSKGVPHHEQAKIVDVYSIFKHNMHVLGVWDIVHPLVMDSKIASQIFADGILDLVFIDADHRYQSVKEDILCWLPKLKNGGILCGHDCEGYYSKYPSKIQKMIDEHLENDYIPNVCHPGVVKALHDYFQEKYSIMPNSVVWYYVKED